MKIFLATEFTGEMTCRIIIKDKLFTFCNGYKSNDYMPIYGGEFANDDEFLQWIKYHFLNEVLDDN